VGAPGKDGGELLRTSNTKRFADPAGAPVDLGCFSPAGYPPKPSPGGTVTLTGLVRYAANGGCTEDAALGTSIEIFPVVRTGDPTTDGTLGPLIGGGLVIDDSFPVVTEPVDNKCDNLRYMRVYSYPGVPLDTELVIKTSGADLAPVYTYNVYASASDSEEDVVVLAVDDFTTWSTVAIGKTIAPGQGMVFGEVHDCGDIRLQHATVDVSAKRTALVYTDDNEDNPLANFSRVATGRLSMFLALELDPGFVRVSSVGLSGGQLSSVGYADVRVFPDAATHVKLRGLRPFQVP
jgi:hypothetical protein